MMIFIFALVTLGGQFFAVIAQLDYDLGSLVAKAREQVGLKHESLARLMGITGPQLSQQVAGQGHLSLHRLLFVAKDRDGRKFLHALWVLVAQEIGLEDRALATEVAHLSAALTQFNERKERAS